MTEPADQSGWRRSLPLWLAVALLAGAAAALWIASRLVWTWDVDTVGANSVVRPVDGGDFQPALPGLAILLLATVAAVLAVSGWPRRALGGLLVLLGCFTAFVLTWRGLSEQRTRYVSDVGFDRWTDDIDRWDVEVAFGIGLTGLAGLLIITAGAVLLATGHRMPRMGGRYRTPGARRAPAAGDRAMWDELDAGRDPTTGPDQRPSQS